MGVSIKNVSHAPVSILLNSRTALHLPPGHEVTGIADAEVQGNAKLAKLLDRRLISLSPASVMQPMAD